MPDGSSLSVSYIKLQAGYFFEREMLRGKKVLLAQRTYTRVLLKQ